MVVRIVVLTVARNCVQTNVLVHANLDVALHARVLVRADVLKDALLHVLNYVLQHVKTLV